MKRKKYAALKEGRFIRPLNGKNKKRRKQKKKKEGENKEIILKNACGLEEGRMHVTNKDDHHSIEKERKEKKGNTWISPFKTLAAPPLLLPL